MLKGINFKEFLSTHQEWHALVEGLCDGFLILLSWASKHKPSEELSKDISGEHHYYAVGLVAGVVCFVIFGIVIYKVVA